MERCGWGDAPGAASAARAGPDQGAGRTSSERASASRRQSLMSIILYDASNRPEHLPDLAQVIQLVEPEDHRAGLPVALLVPVERRYPPVPAPGLDHPPHPPPRLRPPLGPAGQAPD